MKMSYGGLVALIRLTVMPTLIDAASPMRLTVMTQAVEHEHLVAGTQDYVAHRHPELWFVNVMLSQDAYPEMRLHGMVVVLCSLETVDAICRKLACG